VTGQAVSRKFQQERENAATAELSMVAELSTASLLSGAFAFWRFMMSKAS
jgi:hypothetical protein